MYSLDVSTFIEAGKKALADKNYWGALVIALALPSMCSRIEYKGKTEYKLKSGRWDDKACYKDFCKSIFNDGKELASMVLGQEYAEILYALRCDVLHAGEANISADGKRILFDIGDSVGRTEFLEYRIVNVQDFCQSIFRSASLWAANLLKDKTDNRTKYFNTDEYDDSLLYGRLCDKDRADYLEEQFREEIKKSE